MNFDPNRRVDIQHGVLWEEEDPREGGLRIIDQTLLPHEMKILRIRDFDQAQEAVKSLRVRGAPALGVFAGYALYDEMKRSFQERLSAAADDDGELKRLFSRELAAKADILNATRPTAVNLGLVLNEMKAAFDESALGAIRVSRLLPELLERARKVAAEDEELCRLMGEHGATLVNQDARILTHCNTGSLATAGIGTAIGVFYTAHAQGKNITVYADETRPLMQGARLTAWELSRAGVPVYLITDNMAAALVGLEKIDMVMVGADRIAANGDAANKIGTLGAAIIARYYGIPFYVVAPTTTIDVSIADGSAIPIEQRDADEVRGFYGSPVAAADTPVKNPAFDVTPADLISGIVTELGVHRPPYDFAALLGK